MTSSDRTGSAAMPSGLTGMCLLLLLLLLHTGAQGFEILPGDSVDHLEITEQAILETVVQVCRALAQTEGTLFTPPASPLTAAAVTNACGAAQSSKNFRRAILDIILRNVRVDIRHAFNASFHFDEEMFAGGKRIITEGLKAVKESNGRANFKAVRQRLGEIFHPLQDFYSHSNWVELGNTLPNSNLIRSDASIGNIAARSRATCRSCDGDNCTNNILEDIIAEKILTSGYFGIVPILSTKPEGKCSHGGGIDQTSKLEPKGGINKDKFGSSHGHLHTQAASVAVAATSELLQDIRQAAGDRPFLQMMGISKGSSKALCFVIDTTQSMSNDIEAVMAATSFIIDSAVGTENEPSLYILVPFNDPDFGPLVRTTDPDDFKNVIGALTASGGGGAGEMSLSGLQLALTSAPSNSDIFLFTDAPARDQHLKSTVVALIERSQSVVNFVISAEISTRKWRRADSNSQQRLMRTSDAQLYRDLARASGGLAIEVQTSDIPGLTGIIVESSSSSLVTLLQATRNPGRNDNFTFNVDETVENLTVYITGTSVTFRVVSPAGLSQQSSDTTGSLIVRSQSVGNFRTLLLQKQVGQWEIQMVSTNPYTLKIVGQSSIDFLLDFVENSTGLLGGLDALDTRPRAGEPGIFSLSLTGTESATLTEVALVETSGSGEIVGVVQPQERESFIVSVDRLPLVEFVVRVKGRNGSSSSLFQRQSSTNFRPSNLTITADSDSILTPETPFVVPFSVTSTTTGGNLTIRATNDRGFDSASPDTLLVESGRSSNGTVTLSAPLSTASGTDVTLTIEAEAPGGDTNYVVLRFSVINPVTETTPPQCELLSISNCTGSCSSSTWELSVRVSDGDAGTGVDSVSLKQGSGTFNATGSGTGSGRTVTVSYNASCCAPDVELLVADRRGNEGTCLFSLREGSSAALSSSTRVTQPLLLCLSTALLGVLTQTRLGAHGLQITGGDVWLF